MAGEGAEEMAGQRPLVITGPAFFGCTGGIFKSRFSSGNVSNAVTCGQSNQATTQRPASSQKQAEAPQESRTVNRGHQSGVTTENGEGHDEHLDQGVEAEVEDDEKSYFVELDPNTANPSDCTGRGALLKAMPAASSLSPFKSSSPRRFAVDKIKVHVSNLPPSWTGKQLRTLFEPFGQVREYKVLRDEKTGASRGCGFVKYSDVEEAEKATCCMNGHVIEGHGLVVEMAGGRRQTGWAKGNAANSPSRRLPPSPLAARQKKQPGLTGYAATSPQGMAKGADTGPFNRQPLQDFPPAGASTPPWREALQSSIANAPYNLPPPYSTYPPQMGHYEYTAHAQAREYIPQFAAPTPGGQFQHYQGPPLPATHHPTYFGGASSPSNFHPPGGQHAAFSYSPAPYFSTPPRAPRAPPAGGSPQVQEAERARRSHVAAALLPSVDDYPDLVHQSTTNANEVLKFAASAARPTFDSLPQESDAHSGAGVWAADEPHKFPGRFQEHAASMTFANRHATPLQSSPSKYAAPSENEAAFASAGQGSSKEIRERLIGLQISAPAPVGFAAEDAQMRMPVDVQPPQSASGLAAEPIAARNVTRRLLLGDNLGASAFPGALQGGTTAHYYQPMDTDLPTPQTRGNRNAGLQAGAQEYGHFSSGQGFASALPQFACPEFPPESERPSSAYGCQVGSKETDDSSLALKRAVRAARRLSAVSEGSIAAYPQPRAHAIASPPQSETGSTIGRPNERSDSVSRAASERGSARSNSLGKRRVREESEELSSAAKRQQQKAPPSSSTGASFCAASEKAKEDGPGGPEEQLCELEADEPLEQRAFHHGVSNEQNVREGGAYDMPQQLAPERGYEELESERASESEAQSEKSNELDADDEETNEPEVSKARDGQEEQASVADTGDAQDEALVMSGVEKEQYEERAMSEEGEEEPLVTRANKEQEKPEDNRKGLALATSAVIAGAETRQVAPKRRIAPTKFWK